MRQRKEEREAGISILTAALYESKTKDAEIVRLLQKYYGLRENEAQEQIRIERTINYPCRELESYLMSTEGLSQRGGSGLYHQSWHGRLTPARERALETVAKGTVEAD